METDEHQNYANSNKSESLLDQEARSKFSSIVVPSTSTSTSVSQNEFENGKLSFYETNVIQLILLFFLFDRDGYLSSMSERSNTRSSALLPLCVHWKY